MCGFVVDGLPFGEAFVADRGATQSTALMVVLVVLVEVMVVAIVVSTGADCCPSPQSFFCWQ